MSQTFNVTSCQSCPLLQVMRDDNCEGDGVYAPVDYTCKHPQGRAVGFMASSARDKTPPPAGCPLRVNELLVRLSPGVGLHADIKLKEQS